MAYCLASGSTSISEQASGFSCPVIFKSFVKITLFLLPLVPVIEKREESEGEREREEWRERSGEREERERRERSGEREERGEERERGREKKKYETKCGGTM